MITKLVILAWVLLNVATFCMMGIDKRRARHHHSRIPERTLFLFATIGGTLGILLGMKAFRHKTQHNSFRYGMPGLLLAQMAFVMFYGLQKA